MVALFKDEIEDMEWIIYHLICRKEVRFIIFNFKISSKTIRAVTKIFHFMKNAPTASMKND